jgi:hypothetical protein
MIIGSLGNADFGCWILDDLIVFFVEYKIP